MFKKYLEFINEGLSSNTIRIAVLGDIVCENRSLPTIKNTDPFLHVRKFLNEHDFVCGDLETTFSGSTSDRFTEPRFTSDDQFATLLKFIDLVFTSNNHSLDFGIDGLLRTIHILNSNGISYIGTFKSKNQSRYISINIKGRRFSFISFTQFINKREGTYDRISNKEDLNLELSKHLMFYNRNELESTIKQAKEDSDFVVVYSHSDTQEFGMRPTEKYREYIQSIKEMGADIVIGAHPHDFQGAIESSIYSLGNFFSLANIPNKYPINYGCILSIEIKNSDIKYQYIPITTLPNGDFYEVVPFSKIEDDKIKWITRSHKKDLMDKLKEIRQTFKEFQLKEYKIKED